MRNNDILQAYATKRMHGNDAVIYPVGEFWKYWVIYNNGLFVVGKGEGADKRVIFKWNDPEPSEFRYVGFRYCKLKGAA